MKEKLINMYCMYRFRLEADTGKCLVFSYRMGFFRNVEIVALKKTEDCKKEIEQLKMDYTAAGWNSVTSVIYENIEEAEKKLFDSFFYIAESQQRLRDEYNDFCKLQTKRLKNEYTYIEGRYCNREEKVSAGLVEHVVKNAEIHTARLTVLEAAAGYGKTCTVYEILNQLVQRYPDRIPLFIELSKNRMANIFLYVLQSEINEKFTQLSDELVIQKIKEGKIPLIIDGFDELIQWKKSVDVVENPDEQSLSMLSTIADLLGEDSKAWILLTSRRSAIFTGDIFEEWVTTKLGKECEIERLQILKPSVKEWIGKEKYDCLRNNRISIDHISNPVLLTWLRNQSLKEIEDLIKDEDALLSTYFGMLLEREETRQMLNLSVNKLYCIMEQLAANFVQYDITAEYRDFIEELIYDIMQEDLMNYRILYKQQYGNEIGMLSNEDYIGRLLNNSLLDRVSMTSNRIGFINEFIMGILIGDAVCDGYLEVKDLSEKFIEITATAFSSRGCKKRLALYDKIKSALNKADGQCRLTAELNLLNKNNSDYQKVYFNGVYFNKYYVLDSTFKFQDCIFSACIFDHCVINAEVFESARFFNCQFFDATVQGTISECIFLGCMGYEPIEPMDSAEEKKCGDKYEKIILEQFWKPGYKAAEPRRTYTALFKGVASKEYQNIDMALKSLLKQGLLRELNVCYEINTTKMKEIKEILGR